jgi:hypothetical protein
MDYISCDSEIGRFYIPVTKPRCVEGGAGQHNIHQEWTAQVSVSVDYNRQKTHVAQGKQRTDRNEKTEHTCSVPCCAADDKKDAEWQIIFMEIFKILCTRILISSTFYVLGTTSFCDKRCCVWHQINF